MVALSYGGPEALVGRGLAAPPQESPTVLFLTSYLHGPFEPQECPQDRFLATPMWK